MKCVGQRRNCASYPLGDHPCKNQVAVGRDPPMAALTVAGTNLSVCAQACRVVLPMLTAGIRMLPAGALHCNAAPQYACPAPPPRCLPAPAGLPNGYLCLPLARLCCSGLPAGQHRRAALAAQWRIVPASKAVHISASCCAALKRCCLAALRYSAAGLRACRLQCSWCCHRCSAAVAAVLPLPRPRGMDGSKPLPPFTQSKCQPLFSTPLGGYPENFIAICNDCFSPKWARKGVWVGRNGFQGTGCVVEHVVWPYLMPI